MKMGKKYFSSILVTVLLCGCTSTVDKYLKNHPETPQTIKTSMSYDLICLDMTREQLSALRGKPDSIIQDDLDDKETWVYTKLKQSNTPTDTFYYAFDNDKLTRIENSEKYRLRRVEKYFKDHPERSSYKDTVVQAKAKKDMNREEARLSLGEPKEVNKSNTPYTSFEQWIYEAKEKNQINFLYFGDDKLLNWQE